MKQLLLIALLLTAFSLNTAAQTGDAAAPPTPAEFVSDGCSRFPDGDYLDCCVEHDKAYFSGGSWTLRWRADKKLYKCVAAKKGFEHKFIAPVMWAGVRVFGVSFLPTPYRWGFGRKAAKNRRPQKCANKGLCRRERAIDN